MTDTGPSGGCGGVTEPGQPRPRQAPTLIDIPEPFMSQFDRLPLGMQMRVAARVMEAANARFRAENPMCGFSDNEPISSSSMRFLADLWERNDFEESPR